jgi:hypothetical protein
MSTCSGNPPRYGSIHVAMRENGVSHMALHVQMYPTTPSWKPLDTSGNPNLKSNPTKAITSAGCRVMIRVLPRRNRAAFRVVPRDSTPQGCGSTSRTSASGRACLRSVQDPCGCPFIANPHLPSVQRSARQTLRRLKFGSRSITGPVPTQQPTNTAARAVVPPGSPGSARPHARNAD